MPLNSPSLIVASDVRLDKPYTHYDVHLLFQLLILIEFNGIMPGYLFYLQGGQYQEGEKQEIGEETSHTFVAPPISAKNINIYFKKQLVSSNQTKDPKQNILDEVKLVFGDKEKINARIYFLCEHEKNWFLVETQIYKNDSHYTLQLVTHTQHGILQFSPVEDEIVAVIRESISSYDSTAKFINIPKKQGPLALISSKDPNTSAIYALNKMIHQIKGVLLSEIDLISIKLDQIKLVETTMPIGLESREFFLFLHQPRLPYYIVEKEEVIDGRVDSLGSDQPRMSMAIDRLEVPKGKKLLIQHTKILVRELINAGELWIEDSEFKVSGKFDLLPSGQLVHDRFVLHAESVEIHGEYRRKTKDSTLLADEIRASKQIILSQTARLNTTALILVGNSIKNDALIKVKNHGEIRANRLIMYGSWSGKSCHLKINELFVNRGSFFTTQITFDVLGLINFWIIKSSNSLTVNALLDLNFGLMQSFCITRSSIIKLSLLELPDLPEK